MARRDAAGVRLLTRNGHDFAGRFPLAATAVAALPARSCLIDGEAIVTDHKGLAVFDLIRGHRPSAAAVLCAFDLIELDGGDLRREPIETRKSTLKSLLRSKHAGIAFNARGWRNRLPAGLCARLRGHRVEAAGIPVSFRSRRLLAKGQKPGCTRGRAQGRGGVELTNCAVKICKWLNNGPLCHSATFGRNRRADRQCSSSRASRCLPLPAYISAPRSKHNGASRIYFATKVVVVVLDAGRPFP